MLDDAFDGAAPLDDLPLFRRVDESQVNVMRRMLASGLNVPAAHGIGRYFDAFGAIALARQHSRFEGQVALAWNLVAAPDERGRYPFEIAGDDGLRTVDLRPMVRDAVYELIGGETPATISARFHNTLAAATAQLVRQAAGTSTRLPVMLTGGCFQNARLAESVLAELTPGFSVYLHGQVPPGDGGIALGQATVADAATRS
jgi:hydrogenase maturation protein HypF